MDGNTTDLIRKLCTRAGMIMEDTSAEALTISADVSTIHEKLVLLAEAAHAISAIVAAAMVLSRYEDVRYAPTDAKSRA